MDNLKKNLHLVILGGGILLGLVLLYVGFAIRGGAEEQLEQRQTALTRAANPPTGGDLEHATRVRENFDESMSDAETALRSATALLADFNPTMSAADFRGVYPDVIKRLRPRFEVMAERQRNAPMPELIADYEVEERRGAPSDPLRDLEEQLAGTNNDNLRSNWARLRIVEELAATCEALIQAGADRGMGVRLESISIEDLGVGETRGRDTGRNPWETADWEVRLECAPSFALLLMEELTAPSDRTVNGQQRLGFPNFLRAFAYQNLRRPTRAHFNIDREFKARRGWSQDLADDTQEGQERIDEIREELNELEVLIPVRCELRLSAAAFNPEWEPLTDDDGEN